MRAQSGTVGASAFGWRSHSLVLVQSCNRLQHENISQHLPLSSICHTSSLNHLLQSPWYYVHQVVQIIIGRLSQKLCMAAFNYCTELVSLHIFILILYHKIFNGIKMRAVPWPVCCVVHTVFLKPICHKLTSVTHCTVLHSLPYISHMTQVNC